MSYHSKNRGVAASRSLLHFAAHGGPKPRPLVFVEAALLAPEGKGGGRDELIERAATELAECPDAPAAAEEIAAEFFDELPTVDVVPDRVAMAKASSKAPGADAPAPFPAPGSDLPDEGDSCTVKVGRVDSLDDGKRSVEDLRIVCRVLGRAVLKNARLRAVVESIVERVLKLASRVRASDASGGTVLQVAAVTLREATRAAGSGVNFMRTTPAGALTERAIAAGAGVAEASAIAKASDAYDLLRASGGARGMTRERFVELNLQRKQN